MILSVEVSVSIDPQISIPNEGMEASITCFMLGDVAIRGEAIGDVTGPFRYSMCYEGYGPAFVSVDNGLFERDTRKSAEMLAEKLARCRSGEVLFGESSKPLASLIFACRPLAGAVSFRFTVCVFPIV